jgi:hypothetical protein
MPVKTTFETSLSYFKTYLTVKSGLRQFWMHSVRLNSTKLSLPKGLT